MRASTLFLAVSGCTGTGRLYNVKNKLQSREKGEEKLAIVNPHLDKIPVQITLVKMHLSICRTKGFGEEVSKNN